MSNGLAYYGYTAGIGDIFPFLDLSLPPWHVSESLRDIIRSLSSAPEFAWYEHHDDVLIHPTATIEQNVVFKGPTLISEGCFVAANTYFREGVILGPETHVGPGSEVKSSIITGHTALAHLNYVGNSVLGSGINLEAGVVLANHHNESPGQTVRLIYEGDVIDTGVLKFGSLIGDDSKIGANSVLSPGTVLPPSQIVSRLTLVNQLD